MKHHVVKIEQERNKPVPQAASLVEVMRMSNPTPIVFQTPSSAERLENLEYVTI